MVAGVALVAVLAGCGSNASSTQLTIQAGAHVYRLQCEPANRTARNAEAMCNALAREPDMLATPRSVVCGPGATPRERIRVKGSYRGKPVHAEFGDACRAGGDGAGAWIDVLEGA